jgi:hypothetical protein
LSSTGWRRSRFLGNRKAAADVSSYSVPKHQQGECLANHLYSSNQNPLSPSFRKKNQSNFSLSSENASSIGAFSHDCETITIMRGGSATMAGGYPSVVGVSIHQTSSLTDGGKHSIAPVASHTQKGTG